MEFSPEHVRQYYELILKIELPAEGSGYNKWLSLICPFHDDRNPSFSLNPENGVWKCHAHCGQGDMVAFEQKLADCDFKHAKQNIRDVLGLKFATEADHLYYDSKGQFAFGIERKLEPVFKDKKFSVWHYGSQGEKVWKRPEQLFLYHLPEVIHCPTVMILEGEKKADYLRKVLCDHGFPDIAVTSAPLGSNATWDASYTEYLKGKTVYILPDNDVPGFKHANKIITAIRDVVGGLRAIRTPTEDPHDGSDICDFLLKQADPICAFMDLMEKAQTSTDTLQAPAGKTKPIADASRLTDINAADHFTQMFKHSVRYDHQQQRWLLWSDGLWWREDVKNEVVVLAEDAFRGCSKNESRSKINASLYLAAAHHPLSVHCEMDGWNQNQWLLAVGNGIIDLKTGLLRQGTQQDCVTLHTDVAYNPDAQCPTWEKFIAEIFSESEELIDYIHKAVGYSITGSIDEQIFFMCHGLGSNGKSKFLDTLRSVFGNYGQATGSNTFQHGKEQSIPSDLARLADKRFVVASEVDKSARLNESRLKGIVHGDPTPARFLGKDFFEFTPQAKIWFAVNHRPTVSDESHGFWRSVRLIPFTQQFVTLNAGEELPEGAKLADLGLSNKLLAEAEGILKWCVDGCMKYQSAPLITPEKVLAATQQYQNDSDIMDEFFTDTCVRDKELKASGKELWIAYDEWARQNLTDKERLNRKTFGQELASRFKKTTPKNVATYHGIAVKLPGE
jgi:P4 family phage/plasmid primase-like protien